jgi:hypothetical protein
LCPNMGITHQANISLGNLQVPSFHGQDDC